jgi:replicative DNA helicase
MLSFPTIEKKAIGLMIENRKAQRLYSRKFVEEDFTVESCRNAFKAIRESQNVNLHLDLELAVTKYGLMDLLDFGSMFNVEDIKAWYEAISQSTAKRALLQGARKVESLLANESILVKDIHNELIKVNTDVRLKLYGKSNPTKSDIVQAYLKKLEAARNSSGIIGFQIGGQIELDRKLNGWERTDFIVMAGRPGMGKTAHTIDIVKECINQGLTCRYYSLEMPSTQLVTRLVSNLSVNRYSKLSRGIIDSQVEHDRAIDKFLNSKVEIIDKGGQSFDDIYNDAIAAHESGNIDVIIIDFLQLIKGEHDETRTLNDAARGCKELAKELNAVVCGLSQLNRAVETRGGFKIPTLSDLKQSGALEEAADKVLFYYRPSYYDFEPVNVYDPASWDGQNNDCIIVAKNRSGQTGKHYTTFEFDKMGFVDKTQVGTSTADIMPFGDPDEDNPF